MENKKLYKSLIILVTLTFGILGVVLAFFAPDNSSKEDKSNTLDNNIVQISESGFDLVTEYLGEDRWSFKISGQLPTPCFSPNLSIPSNNFNDKSFTLDISQPGNGVICTQVIFDYEEAGEFSAPEDSSFNLAVNYINESSSGSESNQFSFESTYMGDNKWEYTITGDLPTPCHSPNAETITLERFPEIVQITLSINEPSTDAICIQVIEPFEITGTFEASEEAEVEFFNEVTQDSFQDTEKSPRDIILEMN